MATGGGPCWGLPASAVGGAIDLIVWPKWLIHSDPRNSSTLKMAPIISRIFFFVFVCFLFCCVVLFVCFRWVSFFFFGRSQVVQSLPDFGVEIIGKIFSGKESSGKRCQRWKHSTDLGPLVFEGHLFSFSGRGWYSRGGISTYGHP